MSIVKKLIETNSSGTKKEVDSFLILDFLKKSLTVQKDIKDSLTILGKISRNLTNIHKSLAIVTAEKGRKFFDTYLKAKDIHDKKQQSREKSDEITPNTEPSRESKKDNKSLHKLFADSIQISRTALGMQNTIISLLKIGNKSSKQTDLKTVTVPSKNKTESKNIIVNNTSEKEKIKTDNSLFEISENVKIIKFTILDMVKEKDSLQDTENRRESIIPSKSIVKNIGEIKNNKPQNSTNDISSGILKSLMSPLKFLGSIDWSSGIGGIIKSALGVMGTASILEALGGIIGAAIPLVAISAGIGMIYIGGKESYERLKETVNLIKDTYDQTYKQINTIKNKIKEVNESNMTPAEKEKKTKSLHSMEAAAKKDIGYRTGEVATKYSVGTALGGPISGIYSATEEYFNQKDETEALEELSGQRPYISPMKSDIPSYYGKDIFDPTKEFRPSNYTNSGGSFSNPQKYNGFNIVDIAESQKSNNNKQLIDMNNQYQKQSSNNVVNVINNNPVTTVNNSERDMIMSNYIRNSDIANKKYNSATP